MKSFKLQTSNQGEMNGSSVNAESAECRRGPLRKAPFPLRFSADLRHLCVRVKSERRSGAFRTWAAAVFVGSALLGMPWTVRAQNLLLSNAVVHTISGETIQGGQVLVAGGKISEVGPNVTATGATVVDLQGQHLYPGIIALDTILGLTEIGSVRATQDSTESGDYTPDVESWVAVNPDSELIGVTRANGVTFFEPVP